MKITRISIFQKDLNLSHPYYLSGGRLKFERIDSSFVKIETDEGLHGWGEACPWGVTYLPAHGKGTRAVVDEIGPLLLGLDPRRSNHIDRVMDLALPGHLYGKAALDIACWDIRAKAANLPLVDVMGGRYDLPTSIASSISTDTPEGMLAEIDHYRAMGYHVHSAKVGADVDVDIRRIRHMAENQNPGELIFYDVNRAWLPAEAIQVMNATDDLPVMFEQPCETLDQCIAVRARTTQPISIDERLETFEDMIRIQTGRIAEVVNIKLNRVGGLTKATRLRDFCLNTGIKMLTMDTGGTVLADTVVQHFAQSIPPEFRLGTWLCNDMLVDEDEIAPHQGSRNNNGVASAPDQPGIGVEPEPGLIGDPVAVYE
jgi:cis-L-3-hydroxyproline dehydratase